MTNEELITKKTALEAEYAKMEHRTWDVLNERRKSQIRDIIKSIDRQLILNLNHRKTG